MTRKAGLALGQLEGEAPEQGVRLATREKGYQRGMKAKKNRRTGLALIEVRSRVGT